MEERAIHISSVNREKRGTSRPGDFTIKFNPSLKLNPSTVTLNYSKLLIFTLNVPMLFFRKLEE